MAPRPAVVLVHGLWMNRYVCAPLFLALRREGFIPHFYGYPSLGDSLAGNAARLADFVSGLSTQTVHLVGHSLGGLVILRALTEHGQKHSGRVVLLGSPVRGSMVARSIIGRRGSKFIIGNSLAEWNAAPLKSCPGSTEIGIIAGSFRFGIAALFSRSLASPNDGAVAVEETRLPGAKHITLPVSHTGMLLSAQVMRATGTFLKSGSFPSDY